MIGDLLVSVGLITQEQLSLALEAQRTISMPLGSMLVHLGFANEEVMLGVLAREYGVRPWSLDEFPPNPMALAKLAGEVCQRHVVLPVSVDGDTIILAMANPDDVAAVEFVRYVTRMKVEPVMATRLKLITMIDRLYSTGRGALSVDELVDTAIKEYDNDHGIDPNQLEITEEDTAPVINLVNQIIEEAVRARASDIHIEPRRGRLEIRFRIDGQLRHLRDVPGKLRPMMVARLKIMSDLDVAETRLPQDGRISQRVDGRAVDLRISMTPSQHGERVVLRILDRFVGLRRLEEVGFTQHNLELFEELIRVPYGVILVTGPTGSGKTTTLYGVLSELKQETTNIMTCEDPIEYEIDGINQTQINEKFGLTFARQLRAILRQDPDIILVGEIRDSETAETAIRAALTGHLVLSTLHANDAISAIPRLLDMGVEPFLLGTCLVGCVSQRLVRVLCPKCKSTRPPTDLETLIWAAHHRQVPSELPMAVGCPQCTSSGYHGRTAVHEIMPVLGSVGPLIVSRESTEVIKSEAVKYGYRSIQEHALDLIEAGQTTFEEARRMVHLHHAASGPVNETSAPDEADL
jgi:type IV pilus assembly protein PilB